MGWEWKHKLFCEESPPRYGEALLFWKGGGEQVTGPGGPANSGRTGKGDET